MARLLLSSADMDRGREGTGRARKLRREGTSEERSLWKWLRAGRLNGIKFRRQHPVGPYVLDFACASAKVGIELDGAGHLGSNDAIRDEFLRDRGWIVLRFGNDDVVLRLHAVLETILLRIETVCPLPDPLPRGEREAGGGSL